MILKLSPTLSEIPQNTQHVAIYGIGERGRNYQKLITLTRPDINIVCMLDSFKSNKTLSPPVVRANTLQASSKIDTIILASVYWNEMLVELESIKLKKNTCIMRADWFEEYISPNNIERTINHFLKLKEHYQDEFLLYDVLSELFIQTRQREKASTLLRVTREKFPTKSIAHIRYAKHHLYTSSLDEAEKSFRFIKQQFPEKIEGWLGYAQTACAKYEHEKALARYTDVLTHFPEKISGYIGKAHILIILAARKELDSFLNSPETCKVLSPSQRSSLSGLAAFHHNETKQAIEIFKQAKKDYPKEIQTFSEAASVIRPSKKEMHAFLDTPNKDISQQSFNSRTLMQLRAGCYSALGDKKKFKYIFKEHNLLPQNGVVQNWEYLASSKKETPSPDQNIYITDIPHSGLTYLTQTLYQFFPGIIMEGLDYLLKFKDPKGCALAGHISPLESLSFSNATLFHTISNQTWYRLNVIRHPIDRVLYSWASTLRLTGKMPPGKLNGRVLEDYLAGSKGELPSNAMFFPKATRALWLHPKWQNIYFEDYYEERQRYTLWAELFAKLELDDIAKKISQKAIRLAAPRAPKFHYKKLMSQIKPLEEWVQALPKEITDLIYDLGYEI